MDCLINWINEIPVNLYLFQFNEKVMKSNAESLILEKKSENQLMTNNDVFYTIDRLISS